MSMQKTPITITTEDLVTVAEAAKTLGKHIATVYRWIDAGNLVVVKFGGITFIPTSEVERLRAKRKEE